MDMERCHDYVIGQQRRVCQGKAVLRPGRGPSRHDDTICQIQINPPAFFVSIRRVVDLGVRPCFNQALEDIRMPQELRRGGRLGLAEQSWSHRLSVMPQGWLDLPNFSTKRGNNLRYLPR